MNNKCDFTEFNIPHELNYTAFGTAGDMAVVETVAEKYYSALESLSSDIGKEGAVAILYEILKDAVSSEFYISVTGKERMHRYPKLESNVSSIALVKEKKERLKKEENDSALEWSVRETMVQLIDDIDNGVIDYNACFVSLINMKDEDHPFWGFRMAGMRFSGAISLLELQKQDMVLSMIGTQEQL